MDNLVNHSRQASRYLSDKAVIFIGSKLQEVIINEGEGRCKYISGWNDDFVLTHAQNHGFPDTTIAQVMSLRRRVHGNIINIRNTPRPKSKLRQRVDQLDNRVQALEGYLLSKVPNLKF